MDCETIDNNEYISAECAAAEAACDRMGRKGYEGREGRQSCESLQGREGALPVAEKFLSINGEGLRAGRLAAFLRFRGCNLRCGYCDTVWAQEPEGECSWETPEELISFVAQTGAACVTLTGGEPLMQPLLPELVEKMLQAARSGALPADLVVEIETNGSMDLRELDALRDAFRESLRDPFGTLPCPRPELFFTMDVKCPSSGMSSLMEPKNYGCLHAGDCVKMVVGSEEDLEFALRTAVEVERVCGASGEGPQVLLSPVFGSIEPARIVDFMAENGMRDVRLQLQLHKIIWPNVEKGV